MPYVYYYISLRYKEWTFIEVYEHYKALNIENM